MRLPILVLHICGGLVGLLSGAAAMAFRKGSRLHGIAGRVFVVSMLTMSAAGVTLAMMKSQPGNILGGALTFYLVATAWMTARGVTPGTSFFDWGALLMVWAVAVANVTLGTVAALSPSGMVFDYPSGPYFFLGTVAVLATGGYVRMLRRKGISGSERIASHLWRMCFALFIASSSLFLARQRLFPEFMRKSGTLVFLSFLPLILMIYWLIRVRFVDAFKRIFIRMKHA